MSADPGASRHVTPDRLRHLDSLRGIAAFTVLTAHALSVYPLLEDERLDGGPGILQTLVTTTPLGIFVSGGAAVRLFFVLSGFVLALPFVAGHGGTWAGFATRRWLRLWPTFVAALLVGVVLRLAVPPPDLSRAGSFLSPNWEPPLTAFGVLEHVPLVTAFPYYMVDSPMWSLAHEMRISLLFPALMLLVLRAGALVSVLVTVALGVVGATFTGVLGADYVSLGYTLQFLLLFVVGALLARHRAVLGRWYGALPGWLRLVGLALAGACYVAPNLPLPAVLTRAPLDNWVVGLGSAWLILAVLNEPLLQRVLHVRVLTWLGDISYCVYLLHLPVLLATIALAHNHLALPLVMVLALLVSLALAHLVHRWVEVPSTGWARRAGRAVDARVRRRQEVAA